MIKAAILDDEKHCSESLKLLLEKYVDSVEVISEMNDPKEALEKLPEMKPDLLFLDIEMPHLNGFEMLQKLDSIDFEIIFTTAYDDFAIEAFKVCAIDYLLKPIEKEQLIEAVEKYKKHFSDRDFSERFRLFMGKYGASERPKLNKVALPTQEGFEFVGQENIVRCESDSNYTTVVLKEGKAIVVSRTLKDIERMLDNGVFARVHHSHLINLDCIRKYHKGSGGIIVMENGDKVNVSRSRKADFLNRF